MKFKYLYSVIFILFFLIFLIFLYPKEKEDYVKKVISPCEFILENNDIYKINNCETFDSHFSKNNKKLSKKLNLTETEAFILGNFAKFWAIENIESRTIKINKDKIVVENINYKTKFSNSPYALENNEFKNKTSSSKIISNIRHKHYKILNLDNHKSYEINSNNIPKNYLLIKSTERP